MADLIRHLLKESVTLLLRRWRVFARHDCKERSVLEIKD